MSSYYECDEYKKLREEMERNPTIGDTIFCIFELLIFLSPIIILIYAAMIGE